MNRYFISFIGALFIYIIFFAGFLFSSNNKQIKNKTKSFQRVKVSLLQASPKSKQIIKKQEKRKVIKKIIKEKAIEKKIIKKTPQTKLAKIIKKKILKKVKKKKVVIKKIIKKIKHIKKKTIKKIINKKEIKKVNNITKEKKINQKNIVKKQKTKINTEVINNTKQNNKLKELRKEKYFKQIRQIIENNKQYPQKALRRNRQGDVKVSFTITKDGKLKDIKIIKGKKVFHKSVKNAIKNSFPINIEKDLFKKDFELNLTIKFRINT